MKRKPIRFKRKYSTVVLRSKLKKERDFKILKYLQFFLIAGALTAGGFYGWRAVSRFIFTSEHFIIKKIEINGLENIAKSEILALLPFRVGDNIFSVWLSTAKESLQKSRPELKNITMSRRWQKIKISMRERVPIAFFYDGTEPRGLDDANIAFPLCGSWVKDTAGKLPEIRIPDAAERKEVLDFIGLLSAKDRKFYANTARFSIEPMDNVVITLRDGTGIIWGVPKKGRLREKLTKLYEVQKDAVKRFKAVEYINLSYFEDGRVVVKPLK